MRRLLTTRRHLPLDRSDDYLVAWDSVQRAVAGTGGHAWLFRGAAHEDQFLEFIEWSGDAAPPHEDATVAEARTRLDVFAAATATEEWEDVS
jgi:hypothetical protein